METKIEDIEMMYTPVTKKLLKDYVKVHYEENVDISDEALKRELLYLHKNKELDQLFLCEYILSEKRLAY